MYHTTPERGLGTQPVYRTVVTFIGGALMAKSARSDTLRMRRTYEILGGHEHLLDTPSSLIPAGHENEFT